MKLIPSIITFFIASITTDIQPVRFNTYYDNASTSMNTVACSNGANGLVDRFPTLGKLPTFPNVGGVYAVGGWNSTECGSCWRLTYPKTGKTIYVTAIDTIFSGFDLSKKAVNTLTNGAANSPSFDFVNVQSTQVSRFHCGTS